MQFDPLLGLRVAGVDWQATYDQLAKLSEGRHFSGFEGVPLAKLLDINMGQAVSGLGVCAAGVLARGLLWSRSLAASGRRVMSKG